MQKNYFCILALLLAIANHATLGQEVISDQDLEFRLPKSLVPTHYSLQMQPILDDVPGFTRFTAPGTVIITVNCTEATDIVKLHALDLTIDEALTTVTNSDTSQKVAIQSVGYDPENQFFVINLGESLNAGSRYDIYIEFIAPVSQSRLDGMYLDQYVDPETNVTKYVATTLFAAISARRCFPSFDEPQLKAVYSVALGRKENYHALSNMHIVSTEPIPGMDGWFLDNFAPSLPMSTYLVAMIVSDMTYEEAPKDEVGDPTFRVYAPYYFIDRGGGVYAANQTKTVLKQFENYFDSSFMLQKLDSVSLPRFLFNAMENWALITYNDRVLLYFPGETTEQDRYTITSIVAHEVSHHYFGNLVTCEWWTWIWLNEGFATYFSHLGVQLTYPEFNPWEKFITDVYQRAMTADDMPNTHPVASEPTSLADIGGIYDDIVYRKGASLLRMMHSFLTEGVIQAGVRNYIKSKHFATVQQDYFFQKIQEAADELGEILPASVKEIMDTWTLVSGYPLIRVTRINTEEVKLTQEKYQVPPRTSVADDETWWVPITVAVILPNPKEYLIWIPSGTTEVTLSIPDTELFVINPRTEGYYRTLYSPDLLESLLASHGLCSNDGVDKAIASSAKAKILNDYMAFVKTGIATKNNLEKIMTSDFLCLEHESLVVWQTLFNYYTEELLVADKNQNFSSATQTKSTMKSLLPKISKALMRLNYKTHAGDVAVLKSELLFWTCLIEPSLYICNDYVRAEMDMWISNADYESPFPADLEETYLCMAASMDVKYWEKIHDATGTKMSSNGKTRIVSALSCTSNVELLERLVNSHEWLKEFNSKKVALKPSGNTAEINPILRMTIRQLFNEPARNILSAGKARAA